MKIIYRGGYSSEVVQNSFWYEYLELVKEAVEKGKKVALVTLAKQDDDYYNNFINGWPKEVEVINHKTQTTAWESFDVLVFPGGESMSLYNGLKTLNFNLTRIKKRSLVIGDSAGAYVLSSYFYNSPRGEDRGKIIEFVEGFNPSAKVITVGHANNPVYTNNLLLEKVNKFAKEHGLQVQKLLENEAKLLDDNGEFVDLDISRITI